MIKKYKITAEVEIDIQKIFKDNIENYKEDNSISDEAYAIQSIYGVIELNQIRSAIFSDNAPSKKFMECISIAPSTSVIANASNVLKIMEDKKTTYVLLTKQGKFVGYITESILLENYRDNLKNLRIQ